MKGSQELKDEMAGCTAIMVLLKDNKLWCGNAGDSRCIAGVNGDAVALSVDHKPNDPLEMERIISAGGFVEFNRVNGNLALSRALGDFIFKTDDELPQNKQIVSAEPEVQTRVVAEDLDFVLLACDGIWDVLNNQQVCDFVVDKLAANTQPEDICEQLMDRCLAPDCQVGGLGCDNMTVVLVCFLHGKPWQNLVTRCQQFAKERKQRQQVQDDEECEIAAMAVAATATASEGGEDAIMSVAAVVAASSRSSEDDSNDNKIDAAEAAVCSNDEDYVINDNNDNGNSKEGCDVDNKENTENEK